MEPNVCSGDDLETKNQEELERRHRNLLADMADSCTWIVFNGKERDETLATVLPTIPVSQAHFSVPKPNPTLLPSDKPSPVRFLFSNHVTGSHDANTPCSATELKRLSRHPILS